MTAHPFQPRGTDATRRVQCAITGCYLTPDEHLEALASVTSAPRKSRARPLSRHERIRRGLPVCASDDGCYRAPMMDSFDRVRRHGLCRPCYEASLSGRDPSRPHRLVDPVQTLLIHERQQREAVHIAAKALGISASEWWRRAAAEKLGQTSDSVSGGPST